MTIANMAIEAGGKNGIFEADQKTFDYVNARCAANGTKADYEPAVAGREPEVRLRSGVRSRRRWNRPWRCTRIRVIARSPKCSAISRSTAPTWAVARAASCRISWRSRRSSRERKLPDRYLRRARDAGCGGRFAQDPVGRQKRLAMAGGSGRAADGKRQLRRVSGRAGGYLRPHEQAAHCASAQPTAISPAAWGTRNRRFTWRVPYTVAASALTGRITDPREYL